MVTPLAPRRIQRRRTAGWRMPSGAVYVGRPSIWGNPFPIATGDRDLFPRADSVRMYRELVTTGETAFKYGDDVHHFGRREQRRGALHVPTIAQIREHLRGVDLVCWCPLDLECHADFLLEVAR